MDGNLAAYKQYYIEGQTDHKSTKALISRIEYRLAYNRLSLEVDDEWLLRDILWALKNGEEITVMETEYSEPKPQEYRLFMDGNAWCAVCGDFVDLQNSPAGFGDTPTEALQNLLQIFQGATP